MAFPKLFIAIAILLAFTWMQRATIAVGEEYLASGVFYSPQHVAERPWSIHVLRIERNRTKYVWSTELSGGRVFGLSPLSRIVRDTERHQRQQPVAAINGDWFYIQPGNYQGDPRGIQIRNGEIVSDPAPFSSFWIDADGEPHIATIESKMRVALPVGDVEVAIGFNEHRADDQVVLYTPALGHHAADTLLAQQSTRTIGGRDFLLVPAGPEERWNPFQAGKSYEAKVERVHIGGNANLDRDTVVLSVGPRADGPFAQLRAGAIIRLELETSTNLNGVKTAIGGGIRLVKEGRSQVDTRLEVRHPRSAIGWNDDSYFLVVVDGRQPELSIGMTYAELADLCVTLGCAEAMALDGGGSSTLWASGRVLNSPSDGEQRGIANALILVKRRAN